MRGRRPKVGWINGYSSRVRGDPEWQIRRVVCLEKPLRAEGVRTINRHRWTCRIYSGARVMGC